jgi:hypothetical protein
MPRSGAQLDALFDDKQASVRTNPLPFVSTVDSVETPRGSGAQPTVEYSICRIVAVPPGRYPLRSARRVLKSGKILIDNEGFEGKRVSSPFAP